MFTCYLAISEIEFTATGFDPRDDIFSVTVRAVYTYHIQLAVSHLSSCPLEVTASSSLLRGRNGQCHSKFYAVAATVWTSEFASLVVLRESFQEAFVAIVTDELVMRHTTPPRVASPRSCYPSAAQMPTLMGWYFPSIANPPTASRRHSKKSVWFAERRDSFSLPH